MTDRAKVVAAYLRKLASSGGRARAEKLSKEQLSEIGRDAAKKRWANHVKRKDRK